MHNPICRSGWCFALFFLTLLSSQTDGQKQVPYVNSADSISLGIAYADTGAYAKAGALYETVSENDTNYVLALIEDAVAKEALEQDSDAISICKKGLEQESEYDPDFYNTLAGVYMDEGNYADAIKFLQDTVLPKYPNGHKLYFTLGLAQYKTHKFADAINSFEKCIDLDNYDALSHYYLGRCCLEQGRLIPALLSLQFYLVLQPQTSRSFTAVGLIEQMTKNKYQYDKAYSVDPSVYHDSAFTELDLLIRSKIAMDKEYPSTTKINYTFVKQIQLFMEQLKYVPNTGNYWMEKYVPFFTGLQQKKYLEPYLYFIMSSVNDENLQKDVVKDKKPINVFATWADAILTQQRSKKEITVDGKKTTVACTYYDNNMIESMGPENSAGKYTGEWTFYYRHSGNIYSKGMYNDNGEKEGKWHWYYNSGKLKEINNYSNGKREDTAQLWYENGARKAIYIFHNDMYNGDCLEYNVSGILTTKTIYQDDKLTGAATYFYEDGKQHYQANYVNHKFEGALKEYYVDGHVKSIRNMQNDMKNGTSTAYWANGKVQETGEYKDDKQVGDWKTYYNDGSLQKDGTYNLKGEPEGNWAFYYRNGKKQEMQPCNKNGDIDGMDSLFDKDGVLYELQSYKDGIQQGYTFKSKDGQIITSVKIDGKTMPMVYYTPEGTKKLEGLYYDNQKDGEWKYYNAYGGLATIENLSKGKLEGVTTYYYPNGKVEDSVNYTDNEKDGYYVSYHPNGKMDTQGWYVDGTKQGDWYYYDLKGNIIKHDFFVNGAPHGHTDFYETNGLLSEQHFFKYGYLDKCIDYDSTETPICKYISDKGNGKLLVYYNNGNIIHELNYVNGTLEGPEKRHYYDGKLSQEGQYLFGDRQDTLKSYFENGNVDYVYNYDMDNCEGPISSYHRNGSIYETATYSDDNIVGEQKYYYDNGKLSNVNYYEDGAIEGERKVCYGDSLVSAILWFHNGNIVGYSSADSYGKPLQRIPINKGNGDVNCTYPNGNKSFSCKYKNGELTGERLKYAPDGKLLSEENFEADYRNGIQKYYNEGDTTLKEVDNYYYGEEDGICSYYYKTGKLEHEENYVLGTKEGPCRYYDKKGKLIKTVLYYNGNETTETAAK